jgi:hypothetical protein
VDDLWEGGLLLVANSATGKSFDNQLTDDSDRM